MSKSTPTFTLEQVIMHHLRASGPVSLNSIYLYADEQYATAVRERDILICLGSLLQRNLVEFEDDRWRVVQVHLCQEPVATAKKISADTRSPLLYPIIKRDAVLQFRQPYAMVTVSRLIDLCVVDINVSIGHECYSQSFPENQVWSQRKTNDPAPIGLQTKWLTWLLGHVHLCQEDVDILSAEVEALFNYSILELPFDVE